MKKIGLISLVITIGTYILKMVDVFPEQKELLKTISLIFFGVLLGVVLSRFTQNEIGLKKISSKEAAPYVYYGILGAIFIGILITIIQIENLEKVDILKGVLSTVGGFIVFSLLFDWHYIFIPRDKSESISFEDKLILAKTYRLEMNYSRSLYFYNLVKDSLNEYDSRVEQLEEEIEKVKLSQMDRGRLPS